ncbi:glutamate receptor ionotropic, delta-2-like, partial [Centruroides sculpturatus]|uniref:glutamate receptor ionotropic, delta-2-like n=1 Tax=Centruroides sculpturatus TaxID=218467 RepID=UPI000C6E5F13
ITLIFVVTSDNVLFILCEIFRLSTYLTFTVERNYSYEWTLAAIKKPYLVTLDESENKMIGGHRFRVIKVLQDKLQFRYSIAKPVDDYFGGLSENGTWTEMIGKIARQDVDMGIIPFFISFDLFSSMQFSATVGYHNIVFVVKAPEKLSNWGSIIAPFSLTVWISLFVCLIAFGLALHKVLELDFSLQGTKIFLRRSTVFWNLFCTFVNEGMNLYFIRRFPSRFLIGIWWLSIVVIVSSYSGTLMSFLTYPLTEAVPRTIEELSNSVLTNEYSCGTIGKSTIWRSIHSSKLKSSEIISNHIIQNNNFLGLSEAMGKLQKERFALIYSDYVIKKYIPKEDLNKYVFSNDKFSTFMEAYAMKKGFPFTNQINKIIRRLFESGIIEKIDYSENSRVFQTSELHELSVDDVISPILLLILGYILSLLCLFIEMIYLKLFCV